MEASVRPGDQREIGLISLVQAGVFTTVRLAGGWPTRVLFFLFTHSKNGCPIPSTSLRAGSPRFSKDGILCGLHRTDFFFPLRTILAAKIKSKAQEIESCISHPLPKSGKGWGSLF
jgi:hypothetical protein